MDNVNPMMNVKDTSDVAMTIVSQNMDTDQILDAATITVRNG